MKLTESYYPADTSRPILEITLGTLLRQAAGDSSSRAAMVAVAPGAPPRTWSYGELLADAEHGAAWLLKRFPPGSHIAVWAANEPEWIILQCATAIAGMTLVTANPSLRAAELAHVLDAALATAVAFVPEVRGTSMPAILYDALDMLRVRRSEADPPVPTLIPFAGWLDAVRSEQPLASDFPEVRPSDPIQIQFTSGTTGAPKPAQLLHRAMITNADFVNARSGVRRGDVLVSPLPLFHTAGSGLAGFGTFLERGTLILCRVFDPDLVIDAIEHYRAANAWLVPAMLRAVLPRVAEKQPDLSALRTVASGGDLLPQELSRETEETLGVRLTTVYGQTELSPILTQTSPDDPVAIRWGTAGRPLPQAEVRIVDTASQQTCPVGQHGEILARGYQLVSGYFNMPEASARLIDAKGWLHTGDLGFFGPDGTLTITGRLKDMIIRGGENLYPKEIENAIMEHPSVTLAAVVGVPDHQWGEIVAAVVQFTSPEEAVSGNDLTRFLATRLSPQKKPALWFHGTDLPANALGKLQKFLILRQLQAGEISPL